MKRSSLIHTLSLFAGFGVAYTAFTLLHHDAYHLTYTSPLEHISKVHHMTLDQETLFVPDAEDPKVAQTDSFFGFDGTLIYRYYAPDSFGFRFIHPKFTCTIHDTVSLFAASSLTPEFLYVSLKKDTATIKLLNYQKRSLESLFTQPASSFAQAQDLSLLYNGDFSVIVHDTPSALIMHYTRTGNAEVVTHFSDIPVSFSWSPTAPRFAAITLEPSGVYTLHLEDIVTHAVKEISVCDTPCAWSPDGNTLAFVSGNNKPTLVFATFPSFDQIAVAYTGTIYDLAWTHDSRFVVFAEKAFTKSTTYELFRVANPHHSLFDLFFRPQDLLYAHPRSLFPLQSPLTFDFDVQ